ncbi:MAG: plastocyanin/azurin family copper-binding protein [Paracoccaceae bacterium]|nr:plastocyanin/azurin family copper-binding protein [Paracoccaceae bacterium]
MKIKSIIAVGTLLAIATAAYASTEHKIMQAGKKFSERRITISVGDTLNFVNDDGTTHNVHSNSAGHEFDLGAQAPGTESSHVFSKPGKVKVRCAIHPKMKIDVNVE